MLLLRGVLLSCAAAWLLTAAPPSAIAIRNARIVTVSGPVIDKGTVVLRDGLIESVGAEVTPPADARILDGQGLTVYPGLIDALGTLGIVPAAASPATSGATAARGTRAATRNTDTPYTKGPQDRPSNSSWLRAADQIDPADRRIEDARSAGFTSAVSAPSGNIFSGQAALINLGARKSNMVVAASVGQYITMDRRGYAGEYPASLLGAFAYVRQMMLDAGNYRLEKAAYEKRTPGARRPEYDRAVEGVLESPRLLLPARSQVEIERMIRFAADMKAPAVLYGASEGYLAAAAAAQSKTPLLVSLKWPERDRNGDPDAHIGLRTLELWDRAPSTPAALAKAGAPFAFYTDGLALRELPKAMKRAFDAGLSHADAVRAFTLGAAGVYGLTDRLGSIDAGKIANLVVTNGDLFAESTKVKWVFVDGEKYEPSQPEPATESRTGGER